MASSSKESGKCSAKHTVLWICYVVSHTSRRAHQEALVVGDVDRRLILCWQVLPPLDLHVCSQINRMQHCRRHASAA